MATYFNGNSSEIQTSPDGLQTLILMNPSGYVSYSDTHPPPSHSSPTTNSLFFYDSSSNSLSNAPPPPPSHSTQHLVGLPLSATNVLSTPDPNSHYIHHHNDLSALHGFAPRVHYNLWNPVDMEARETQRAQQGLSLSLSSQQPRFGSFRGDREVLPAQTQAMGVVISGGSPSSISGISGVTNGVPGIQGVLLNSKYLNATQELLEEVVRVGNGIKSEFSKKSGGKQSKTVGELSPMVVTGDGSVAGDEGTEKRAIELSTADRQEVQLKKSKLINMIDEVEQRYRQYHHQMQIVITTFEQAAGSGSARTYTALALETISKQFRCLKDAITGQIRAANKSLGEEDCNGGKIEGSRLKYVDHQLRQQRALQQLGMIQQNAWRPQRGLPERSVSVLRAWLFEHFLHPYPKDSDKHMLAKQTGLTRSQVSNWFINARVRLWKPMVEEMYMEEIKEQEQNRTGQKLSKSSDDNNASKSIGPSQAKSPTIHENQTTSFNSVQENSTNQHFPSKISISTTPTTSPTQENTRNQSGLFNLIGSSELLEGITQGSPKKSRNSEFMQSHNSLINMDVKPSSEVNNDQITPIKFGNIERQDRDEYSFMGSQNNFMGGFGQYPIGEIGRFDTEQFTQRFSGNSVSLTLGLPHCENLSLSGAHQNFLPNQNIHLGRRVDIGDPNHHDFGGMSNSTPHSSAGFESINIQNRKGFAAQLLQDFVT